MRAVMRKQQEVTAGGQEDWARWIDTPARRRSNEENAAELVLHQQLGPKLQPAGWAVGGWALMNEHPSARLCLELLIWMSR